MGLITRIGRAPGVRRLVRKRVGDGVVAESPDPEDLDLPMTAVELARRHGDVPPPAGHGPTSWQV